MTNNSQQTLVAVRSKEAIPVWTVEVEMRLNRTRIDVCSYLTSSLLLMKASSRHGIVYPLKILCLPCNFQLYNLVPRATNTTLTFAPCNRWRVFLQGGIFQLQSLIASAQSGGYSREYRPGLGCGQIEGKKFKMRNLGGRRGRSVFSREEF